jgi:DNA-binding NarL/FixJ family response regulator
VTAPATPTRVLVVDDNAVVRAVLRDMLDDGCALVVIGEAANGIEALELATSERPDVTLLDHRMPLRDGLSVVTALSGYTRVLMLTRSGADDVVLAAIRAGAFGYLIHGQFSPAELVSAVRTVARGGSHLSPSAARVLVGSVRAAPAPTDRFGLTRREREIMELIASGFTNKAIAQHLYLAPKTVQNHINRLFAKLGVHNRAGALAAWRD